MKSWSDSPIHGHFCFKIFLDTNIISFLIDNSHEGLTYFLELANDNNFTNLVSSKFVMFEFIGIRKREHYLRKVAANVDKSSKGELNFSSLLNQKHLTTFSAPEVNFEEIVSDIKKDVDEELNTVISGFNIDFTYSDLHDGQLSPTFDICLLSKISIQDSLVLISSILPSSKIKNSNILVLTDDGGFSDEFNNNDKIESLLNGHSLIKPFMELISNFSIQSCPSKNLKKENNKENVKQLFIDLFVNLIKNNNQDYLLGRTFKPRNLPDDCICFKLDPNRKIPQNIYITILSKELEFIYTSKNKIPSFWLNGNILPHDFSCTNESEETNISFKIHKFDSEGKEEKVSMEIINCLRCDGNFVFIHPDSFI